ncbi:unnamed protein product [Alternaria alternata]
MTGTSMSTPSVAGVYDLFGQVYGKLEPKRLRRIFTHTSKRLAPGTTGQTAYLDILAPVAQQGSELAQAWNADRATLEINVDSLMLNDTLGTTSLAFIPSLSPTLAPQKSGFIAWGDKLVLPYLGVGGRYTPAPANASYVIPRPDPQNPPMTHRGYMSEVPNSAYMNPTVGFYLCCVLEIFQVDKFVAALAGFAQTYIARSEVRAYFNGLMASGEVLDEVSDRMKVSALRIVCDGEKVEDWNVAESSSFAVQYAS